MRIGIDARFALGPRRGIGVYSLNLIRSLAALDCDHEFILFTSRADEKGELPLDSRFKVKVLKPAFYPLWEQVLLPAAAWVERVEILHCLGNTAPALLPGRIRLILTIHDVSYLKSTAIVPKPSILYQRLGRIYRKIVVPEVAANAAHIISVSNFALQDISAHLSGLENLPKSATYLAPDVHFRKIPAADYSESLKGKFGIDFPYILSVTGRGPQKNVIFSAKAFLALKARGAIGQKLVLVGVPRSEVDPALTSRESDLSKEYIHFIEWVDARELLYLYNGADLFVFGSLYESFGLPPLEALACGTPTLLAHTGALPEISGDAACYFDPRSSVDLQDCLLRMARDPLLRDKMHRGAFDRAAQFNWKSTAESTLDVYQSLRFTARTKKLDPRFKVA